MKTVKILRKIDGGTQFVGYAKIDPSLEILTQLQNAVNSYGYDYKDNLFLIEEVKNFPKT